MGQSKSKALKYPHYPPPPGYPPYGPVYPYGVPPPVGYAPGYHAPVIPPGYAPIAMPQPQHMMGWPPQERRKKKKRKESKSSTGYVPAQQRNQQRTTNVNTGNVQPAPPGMLENLPPGFIPTNIAPNPPGVFSTGPVIPPVISGDSAAQGARPPPLFTPGVPDAAPLNNFASSEPQPQRRTATPFIPAFPLVDASDDESESPEQGERTSSPHHRSQSRSHQRHASTSRHSPPTFQPIGPNDPLASPGVPPNPLPDPPRDLYQLSPYKQLLHLPNTMALLTAVTNPRPGYVNDPNVTVVRSATNPGMAGVGAGANAIQPGLKKKKRGLFSFGSRRNREPTSEPAHRPHQLANIQFVPIYQNAPPPQGSTSAAPTSLPAHPAAGPSTGPGTLYHPAQPPVPPIATPPSPPPQRSPPHDIHAQDESEDSSEDGHALPPDAYRSMSPTSHHTSRSHRSQHQQQQQQQQQRPFYQVNQQPQPQPQPQSQNQPRNQPSPSQPYFVSANGSVIEFSQTSLPDFLNHSPHEVTYNGKEYPTAMHLHEAMKFMDHKPDVAERIRRAPREGVYPLAAEWAAWARTDWGTVFLDKMEEVLWHKFNQHVDLRTMLLKTGQSELVYADPQDPYWGSGTRYGQGGDYHGTNYLGMLLKKVRERLLAGGWT